MGLTVPSVPHASVVWRHAGARGVMVAMLQSGAEGCIPGDGADACNDADARAGIRMVAMLESDAESGIRGDVAEVRRRKEAFGTNTYTKSKLKSFLGHLLDALSDVFLIALLICAAVSIGYGIKEHGLKDGWYDGAAILLAVCLVSGVFAVINHIQAKHDDKLAWESADFAVSVVRDARRQEVSVFDVVVGDVVILNTGDTVPADGVFLEGHGLRLDESGMIGEPNGVEIDVDINPFLAAGAKVVHGHGRMLVTAVGTNTELGELMMSIGQNDPVPLQQRLEGLTTTIGNIGVAVSLVAFTLLTGQLRRLPRTLRC